MNKEISQHALLQLEHRTGAPDAKGASRRDVLRAMAAAGMMSLTGAGLLDRERRGIRAGEAEAGRQDPRGDAVRIGRRHARSGEGRARHGLCARHSCSTTA